MGRNNRTSKAPHAGKRKQYRSPETKARSLANLVRFVRGQSGNEGGRPSNAGLTKRELVNSLTAARLTAAELRRIARDPAVDHPMRAAAEQCLATITVPDLADFEPFLTGKKTLAELRDSGVDTTLIKSLSRGKDGRLRIELHDRAADAFTMLIEQTAGKPTQPMQLDGEIRFNPITLEGDQQAATEEPPAAGPAKTEADEGDDAPDDPGT